MYIKAQTECKYRILAEVQRNGHTISFDVLYRAQSTRYRDIKQEIGIKEGEYIRQYRPMLNTQIPKEEDFHKYDTQKLDVKAILKQLL